MADRQGGPIKRVLRTSRCLWEQRRCLAILVLEWLGRRAVMAIDWVLRQAYGIIHFSDNPTCVLRISVGQSDRWITLSDGIEIGQGESVVELHLWNERIPKIPLAGPTLGWGHEMVRLTRESLQELALYLELLFPSESFRALRGEAGFIPGSSLTEAREVAESLGFDLVIVDQPGWRFWRRRFWDNLFSYLLIWAFNPRSLRNKKLGNLVRCQFWMSRERLRSNYLAACPRTGEVAVADKARAGRR